LLLLLARWLTTNRVNPLNSRLLKRADGVPKLCFGVWVIALWGIAAALAGGGLALYNAVTSRFAEEEFFILVTGLYLSLFWVMLSLGYYLTFKQRTPVHSRRMSRIPRSNIHHSSFIIYHSSYSLPGSLVAGLLLLAGLGGWSLAQYQGSFFPETAPAYPGITEDNPFLCETSPAPAESISRNQIEQALVNHLTIASDGTSPLDTLAAGSLAIYTGDPAYAATFRDLLLQEAALGLYTSPAHSVKWGQLEAALRAARLDLVSQRFPDLFSSADQALLRAWFAQINRRALTVEWVDWFYATAYAKRPEGPYENQEIGSGLLALLTQTGWTGPDLLAQNRAYLATAPLGWRSLFRNTDDAYMYQGVWLSNAWWIYNYRQTAGLDTAKAPQNMALAFRWLLALALPDGEAPLYNVQGSPAMAEYYLSGAMLLSDPALTWLAGKALSRPLKPQEGYHLYSGILLGHLDLPQAQPPTLGSCLLFGNSGLPTRKGPLGPDKVVLRDGWMDEATYALLNLRFSGWHRYKATNTLTLLYQAGPLVTEKVTADDFWWLPAGRSAFRDKRVPRENLNGLLLPKAGLPWVIWVLSGLGSPWRQDPPAYAEVVDFFTTGLVDGAKTVISDWHHWRHERTLYMIRDGLVLVIDKAEKTDPDRASGPPALIWHLNGSGDLEAGGVQLDNDRRPARLVWSDGAGQTMTLKPEPAGGLFLRDPNWALLYTAPDPQRLNLATAFLTGSLAEGEMTLTFIEETQGLSAIWQGDQARISLLHNAGESNLAYDGLATDGELLVLVEEEAGRTNHLCYRGGQHLAVTLSQPPEQVLSEQGEPLPQGITWAMDEQRLVIQLAGTAQAGCFLVR